ncbi:Tumor necrosis factor receptor superfamily member 22 [Lemmus lemmus]
MCAVPKHEEELKEQSSGVVWEAAQRRGTRLQASTKRIWKYQEMVADCSATSNRKCQCRMGHFYADPQFPELCLRCSKCPQGSPVLQKCNFTANTVCSSPGTNQRNRLYLLTVLPTLAVIAVFCYCLCR